MILRVLLAFLVRVQHRSRAFLLWAGGVYLNALEERFLAEQKYV